MMIYASKGQPASRKGLFLELAPPNAVVFDRLFDSSGTHIQTMEFRVMRRQYTKIKVHTTCAD